MASIWCLRQGLAKPVDSETTGVWGPPGDWGIKGWRRDLWRLRSGRKRYRMEVDARPYRGFVNCGTVTEWWLIGLEIRPHQTGASPMRWIGYPNGTGLSKPTGGWLSLAFRVFLRWSNEKSHSACPEPVTFRSTVRVKHLSSRYRTGA